MPNHKLSSKSGKSHRSYDQESKMNRTSKPSKRREEPPVLSESESEMETESEVEDMAHATVPDDSRRKKTSVTRSNKTRGAPQQRKPAAQEAGASDVEEEPRPDVKPGSGGFLFALALMRGHQPDPIRFKAVNSLIPDSGMMFEVVYQMTKLLSDKTKLIKTCPDYTSIGLNLYYSLVYYYHILRARDALGELTRAQRRTLRIFESIGKPEAWPIAGPLTHFVQSLGAVELDDNMFSMIVPTFPDLSPLKDGEDLKDLQKVEGAGRVPLIPAYQQFLYLYGKGDAEYDADRFVYVPTKITGHKTDFLQIEKTEKNDQPFQALALNRAWNEPAETEEPSGPYSAGARQVKIARWRIPEVKKANLGQLDQFVFIDTEDTKWIKNLLRMAQAVNAYFAGSTNLGAIPPLTVRETFTKVNYTKTTAIVLKDDTWYYTRANWHLSYKANTHGDQSSVLIAGAIAASVNAHYDAKLIPLTAITNHFDAKETGPYFNNDLTVGVSVPLAQCEGTNLPDPCNDIQEIMNASMFMNL